VLGVVLLFVAISGGHIIYSLAGLVIFGGFTILDFNRLRRVNTQSAVPIAAGIFLDVFNIFLFRLRLFGDGRN
jgi:FtsH-binding integral membrane protein